MTSLPNWRVSRIRVSKPWMVIGPMALVLLVLLGVLAASLGRSQAQARRDLERGFRDRARIEAAALDQAIFVGATAQDALDVAHDLSGARIGAKAIKAFGGPGSMFVSYARVSDSHGRVLASTRGSPPPPPPGSPIAAELNATPTGEVSLSDVRPGPRPGSSVIEWSTPFSTAHGRRTLSLGVGVGLVNTVLSTYLSGLPSSDGTRTFVLDRAGRVVGSLNGDAVPGDPLPDVRLLRALVRHGSGSDGSRYFAAAPIRGSHWRVVLMDPNARLYMSVAGLRTWLPWTILAAFALALTAGLLLLKRVLESAAALRAANEGLEASNRGLELRASELERARAEEARERAEQANFAKSEFLSRMSHELRTPLNAILGFAQLIEMDRLEEPQGARVEQILRGGRHLLDLINEVLEMSRIEGGTLTISLEPVHVASTIESVLELTAPLAGKRHVRLDCTLDAGEDRHVRADHQRLRQVLLNLLSNAVKYNHEDGSVTVSLEGASEGRLRILVSDTGPGIDDAQLDKLFSPFERLGAEYSEVEGTGLGLALSKRLVEAMGGTLEVQTERGVGSTFAVELQLERSPSEAAAELVAAETAATNGQGGDVLTLLCIEDNRANLRLLEDIFGSRLGVTLMLASRGEEGIRLARERRPDMILLDLHLPDVGGAVVLERLRADPATRDVPVVVISADATEGQIARLRAAGAQDYLTKPLDIARLLEVVDEQVAAAHA